GLQPAPSAARLSDLTFLFHLRQVCANPQLGGYTQVLAASVEAFADWLEGEFTTEGVNLPAINVVVDLRITRWRYLKMCADISRHSLARLETNVRHLRSLLDRAGRPVGDQEGYLAVEDFYEWFYRG